MRGWKGIGEGANNLFQMKQTKVMGQNKGGDFRTCQLSLSRITCTLFDALGEGEEYSDDLGEDEEESDDFGDDEEDSDDSGEDEEDSSNSGEEDNGMYEVWENSEAE
jgi:hypothetical protein